MRNHDEPLAVFGKPNNRYRNFMRQQPLDAVADSFYAFHSRHQHLFVTKTRSVIEQSLSYQARHDQSYRRALLFIC